MYLPHLLSTLLIVGCFAMAARLDLWHQDWRGARRTNVLSMLMGDSRRLFANHFFAKADAYFHSGYYPSIFDEPKREEKSHMEESTGGHHEGETEEEHRAHAGHEEGEFLDAPRDWIEAFGRNFSPSEHVHMEGGDDSREILPWLRLTAELDPQKIETYIIAAYTLSTQLNKPKEAEQFLREGLRANPDSYEILFEMGRVRDETYHDVSSAKNLMELALKKWQQQAAAGRKPDELVSARILISLANLEEREHNWDRAIIYLQRLMEISPSKNELEKRIQELQGKMAKP